MHIIGSRISLISKKNIRYEGTLYSINESDATVALQSVKSYGTEGRELLDTTGASTFVPPNDVVHAYLLFRGQDIKDLHVHENQPAKEEAAQADSTPTEESNKQPAPAPAATKAAASKPVEKEQKAEEKKKVAEKPAPKKKQADNKQSKQTTAPAPAKKVDYASKVKDGAQHTNDSKENKPQKKQQGGSTNKGGGNTKNQSMVGTGASLLNRKARGAKGDQG